MLIIISSVSDNLTIFFNFFCLFDYRKNIFKFIIYFSLILLLITYDSFKKLVSLSLITEIIDVFLLILLKEKSETYKDKDRRNYIIYLIPQIYKE